MTPAEIRVAEALFSVLSPFHAIGESVLCGVRHVSADGCLGRIILDLEVASLVVTANENDDSIGVEVTERVGNEAKLEGADSCQGDPWKGFFGKPFGWGWITVNQQGYCDGLLLSFEGIIPQLLLSVIASSIKVSRITVPQ